MPKIRKLIPYNKTCIITYYKLCMNKGIHNTTIGGWNKKHRNIKLATNLVTVCFLKMVPSVTCILKDSYTQMIYVKSVH